MAPVSSPEYQHMLARLRQASRNAGLTQLQVAQHLGMRQTFVSKVELGERRIDPIELTRFATIYGKLVLWLLGIEN